MKPIEFLREIAVPARSPSVLFAVILFYLLLEVALIARVFGLVIFLVLVAQLLVFALPALLRYLMVVLEARAFGREPEPLDIDLFPWVGRTWTLFPVVHAVAFASLVYVTMSQYGNGAALLVALGYMAFLPASLMTLAITHSALASLNPLTLFELVRRRGFAYLLGPLFAVAATWLVLRLQHSLGVDWLTEFAGLYLLFAAFALFGGLARTLDIRRELYMPMPAGMDEEVDNERQLLQRTAVLNHAYGIISRGNRDKGLQHIYATLADDPYDDAGWAWFFENMLRWENPEAALVFGQRYVHELLRCGENVKAVKVMMRCRLVNPAFKPLAEDIELAAAAAEDCQNDELASFLR